MTIAAVAVFAAVFLAGAGSASASTVRSNAVRQPPGIYAYTVLESFPKTAGLPLGGVAVDQYGNVFGTTTDGGNGYGNIFELSNNGTNYHYSQLYAFGNPSTSSGAYPMGDTYLDSNGNIFGTASAGGGAGYNGTIFEASPHGSKYTYQVLQALIAGGAWGEIPLSGVSSDGAGHIFGTTSQGGACGGGEAFELGVGPIHDFGCQNDVTHTASDLLIDSSGALYGTSEYGGLKACKEGCGLAYKLTPGPTGYIKSNAHQFRGGNDGAYPIGPLALGRHGNLFGTTSGGGASGFGTVYELLPASRQKTGFKERVVYTFAGGQDGSSPIGGLLPVGENIYGTTRDGGAYGGGTIFMLTPHKRTYVKYIVHNFKTQDGTAPLSSLALYKSTIFGTASTAGPNGGGTVYSLAL